MSTVFDFRSLRLPKLSRASIIVGSLAIVAALVLGFLGIQLYKKLTNNTVVAYFPVANALYNSGRIVITGVKVGTIDEVAPSSSTRWRPPPLLQPVQSPRRCAGG